MPDEPNTQAPSVEAAPTDAAPAAERSEPAAQEPTQDRSWWTRLRLGRRHVDEPPASAEAEDAQANGAQSSARPVSEEELQRLVQAEADRREYRRQQQGAAEHRRKLRDTDPYAYAEQERQAEQQAAAMAAREQQFTTLLGNVGVQHDRVAIDPIVFALDDTERNRILKLQGAGVGLDGRKLVVTEALKALEKRWKAEGAADAEKRLRKNPTFRKQVFAEHRGSVPEPDLLPGSGAVEGDGSVSDLLRRSLGR